jgi:hypothetical protein
MKDSRNKGPLDAGTTRRRFVRLAAGGAALIPLASLGGCSEEQAAEKTPAMAATEPTPEPAPVPQRPAATPAPEPAEVSQSSAASNQPIKLDESDPVASSLGYRQSASEVDQSQFGKYEPGQACANCTLFQPDGSSEEGWGACSIFPGKLVNAGGWCSVYSPKA